MGWVPWIKTSTLEGQKVEAEGGRDKGEPEKQSFQLKSTCQCKRVGIKGKARAGPPRMATQ